jgi:hypothetical protein
MVPRYALRKLSFLPPPVPTHALHTQSATNGAQRRASTAAMRARHRPQALGASDRAAQHPQRLRGPLPTVWSRFATSIVSGARRNPKVQTTSTHRPRAETVEPPIAPSGRAIGDLVGHALSVCSGRPPVSSREHGVTAANTYRLAGGASRLYYILCMGSARATGHLVPLRTKRRQAEQRHAGQLAAKDARARGERCCGRGQGLASRCGGAAGGTSRAHAAARGEDGGASKR